MSRSGYSDDCDDAQLNLWRGAVESAIRGQRGQKLLRELAAAMDAMPVKELISDQLEADGSYCALGVVGQARGIDMKKIDPDCRKQVSRAFDIAPAMAAEIAFMNDYDDEWTWGSETETPAERWVRMRKWVDEQIKERNTPTAPTAHN